MRKNVSNQTMDEELKIFLGTKPEVEEQKPATVPAGMPAQEHEDVQAGTDENMNEQTGETVQENTEAILQHYQELGVDVRWELNPGNHFRDVAMRSAKGIKAILEA